MAKRRKYQLKRRAERQAETRRRIVEAATELHTTVGPARTTISAIARRASVQRLTVYRHFPDELALSWACSAHYQAQHPPPTPGPWKAIPGFEERVRVALSELYAYYARTEARWANILRDMEVLPYLQVVAKERSRFLQEIRDVLVLGSPAPGPRRPLLLAAVGHAIEFRTWQSLVRRHGLSQGQAVELMVVLVREAAQLAPSGALQPQAPVRTGPPEAEQEGLN